MKFEKYLLQQAEKDIHEELTEEDVEFCRRLAAEQPIKIKKSAKRLWVGFGSGAAVAALAAAIIIPVAIFNRPASDILYKDENIVNKISNIEELNNNSNYYLIEEIDNLEYRIELYYDSVSNDNLYYTVNVTSDLSNYSLYVIVNENYNLKFEMSDSLTSKQLLQYEINYYSESVDGLINTEARYRGYVKSSSYYTYIAYTQLIDLGEQAFLDEIQSVLKVKQQ